MHTPIKQVTTAQFTALLEAQGLPRKKLTFKCPLCCTLQNADDLIGAGVGTTLEEVGKYLGFSCIGRFTGAAAPRKVPDGAPCNWTLGGLLQLHKLEVIKDGSPHPCFDVATPEEARAHIAKASPVTV